MVTAVGLTLLFALGGVGYLFLARRADIGPLGRIKAYADGGREAAAPDIDVWEEAIGGRSGGLESARLRRHLDFVNSALASPQLTSAAVADAAAARDLLAAVESIQARAGITDPANCEILDLPFDATAAELLATLHPGPFSDYRELRGLATACGELVAAAGRPRSTRDEDVVTDDLWSLLLAAAGADDLDGDDTARDTVRRGFIRSLGMSEVTSADALVMLVRRSLAAAAQTSPPKVIDRTAPPPPSTTPQPSTPPQPVAGNPVAPSPASRSQETGASEAFTKLTTLLVELKRDRKPFWPLSPAPGTVMSAAIPHLDAEVVVGTTPGFDPRAEKDGERRWKIMVGDLCLAVVDMKDGIRLEKGTASDDAFKKHERFLQFMPIAFKRPDKPPGKDDWFVLSPRPSSVQLAAGQSLWDLFCGDEGHVSLPAGPDWKAAANVTWKRRKIPVEGSPLTLEVVPSSGGKWQLEISGRVGGEAGRDYTLVEPIAVQFGVGRLGRAGKAWTEDQTRLQIIRFSAAATPEAELKNMGIRDGVVSDFGNTDRKYTAVPIILAALLSKASARQLRPSETKELMALWAPLPSDDEKPSNSGPRHNFDGNAYSSLEGLRSSVLAFLCDPGDEENAFSRMYGNFETRKARPSHPDAHNEPTRQKNESDQDFVIRRETALASHENDRAAWTAWVTRAREDLQPHATNRDTLRRFIFIEESEKGATSRDQPGQPASLDPEIAAAHILLELDGLIVAKVYREQIQDLLHRVPVAALFEGEETLAWSIPGLHSPVIVSVARILPAANLAPPPTTLRDAVPESAAYSTEL